MHANTSGTLLLEPEAVRVDEDVLLDDAPSERPLSPDSASISGMQRGVTLLITGGPFLALALAVPLFWGHLINLSDVLIGLGMYVVAIIGLVVGFHRLFTHGSFKATRGLKIALAVAGSLGVEGSVTSWVATHRRHHRFSDVEGDPHSPHRYGSGTAHVAHGLWFAHVGWLFSPDSTSAERYAPDMLADPDLQLISRLFPVLAIASLVIPFGIGYALSGTLVGAATALLWGGLVRMAVLHHVTWSVNSICHVFGKQPFANRDHSTNVAALALLTFGESWHNAHHAHPAWARHGALPGQIDPAARIIAVLEGLGLATKVRWPRLASVPS